MIGDVTDVRIHPGLLAALSSMLLHACHIHLEPDVREEMVGIDVDFERKGVYKDGHDSVTIYLTSAKRY
jgi:hypothetical protein